MLITKILSFKDFTGNPADGIDNFNLAVFGRMSEGEINFYAKAPDNFKEIGAIKKLKTSKVAFLIKEQPDIFWGTGNIKELLFLLIKPIKTKYIINFHTILIKGSGPWKVKTPWFLRKMIFSRADAIICVSEFSAQTVRRYFPDKKVFAVLNGVDLKLFNPKKKNKDYLKEKYKMDFFQPLAVFIGTLLPRKRPDIFIKLARMIPSVNFVAVGCQSKTNFLAEAKNLKNFQWVEKMSREDIATLLASAQIFIFPSLNEPSAAVILEAMASGAVPIVSQSGGNSEFLSEGQEGFLVAFNKDEIFNFAEKIKTLVNNENLRNKMSQACRLKATNHSWTVVTAQYERLLI